MAINYIAVLVAAVAYMVLGMLWYSPSGFGKKWMRLVGLSKSDLKKQQKKGKKCMIWAFVAALVMAYVLAFFVKLVGATTIVTGAEVGFWAWLGFVATTSMGIVLWEGKPKELYILNNAFYLISLVIMGAILAIM